METEVAKWAMKSSHVSLIPAQSRESVAVNGMLTESLASHEPAQCLEPGAVETGALAAKATAPVSHSKGVVNRRTSTRQIRTIKDSSKRVTFRKFLSQKTDLRTR